MDKKIAVASTDGKLVNAHFGKTDTFYILGSDETEAFKLLEIRQVPPICQGADHEEAALLERVEALSDCAYILVARIGIRAEQALAAKGIEVFEMPGVIEASVDRMQRYLAIQERIERKRQPTAAGDFSKAAESI